MAKLINVKTCSSIEEAEAAKKLLDSAGVLCTVSTSDSISESQETADTQETIHVMVSEHEAAQALRILEECTASDIKLVEVQNAHSYRPLHTLKKVMVFLLLGGLGWLIAACLRFESLISTTDEYILDIYWYLSIVFVVAFLVCALISRIIIKKHTEKKE